MSLSRRRFLATSGLAGAGVLAAATADRLVYAPAPAAAATPTVLPAPARSGIDHIVVVMMENRSFDHFLGWLPGADGKQAGLIFSDRYGVKHRTHHLATYNGCGFNDPDHSYEGGRIELDGGKCDGWLRAGTNDALSIGYYTQSDLPFLGRAALGWTTFDRYFAAVMAETYPNRFYLHSAQTDRTHNSTTTSTLPTIWDRLAGAGVSHQYYFGDIPFTALWGTKYADISKPYGAFLAAAAAGQLPGVSFVDPRFVDESSGSSGDDHPHADIRVGEQFLNEVYHAVTTSPNWPRTMLVITFDEWGGFFDHVPPGTAPDVSPHTALRGFRVPSILISPRARRGYISHNVYDHTSVLKAIEWRFNLAPLTPRDAHARNIAEVLDFGHAPNLKAPSYSVPAATPIPCTVSEQAQQVEGPEETEWPAIRTKALADGWTLPS